MYGVLGSEGYSLHQEIVSFDDTHMVDNNLSPEETTQMTCDGMHSIFATKFVEQILSENPSSGSETDKFDNDVIAPAVPIPTASATSDGGGIAEAAAAAAAAKKKDSPRAFAGGGIAAAAAAAAAKKQERGPGSGRCGHPLFKDMLGAVMEAGASEASANPRDLPSFYCLYLLATRQKSLYEVGRAGQQGFSSKQDLKKDSEHSEDACSDMTILSKKLLLRSLAISNQATSVGMVGWLEYGSSNQLERTLNLPFEVLQRLACNLGGNGDWGKASDVLSSLVMRCEQHLPAYHPTTLSSMLDLAGALTMASEYSLAKGMVQRTSDLLAVYLSEHESMFFDRRHSQVLFKHNPEAVFRVDDGADAIGLIKAFTTAFHKELSREFLSLIGPEHKITLLNHMLVADAFGVLANCLSAGESSLIRGKRKSKKSGYQYYWSLAYIHYQRALKGWVKIGTLSHPNAVSAAYSVARCLRELGKPDQALKVLESLVPCIDVLESGQSRSESVEKEITRDPFASITFLPPLSSSESQGKVVFSIPICRKEQLMVNCLWMMAALTVEQSPDERGRMRALNLLHSASKALRRVLGRTEDMDDVTRRTCLELYECVEEEARLLFEPIPLIDIPREEREEDRPSETERWNVLTPMRKTRWQAQHWKDPHKGGTKPAGSVSLI